MVGAAWGGRRAVDDPPVDRIDAARLPSALTGLTGAGYTLAIIDTAGVDSVATSAAMRAADLVIIPARPSTLDLEASRPTMAARSRFQALSLLGRYRRSCGADHDAPLGSPGCFRDGRQQGPWSRGAVDVINRRMEEPNTSKRPSLEARPERTTLQRDKRHDVERDDAATLSHRPKADAAGGAVMGSISTKWAQKALKEIARILSQVTRHPD
jgi:hypothetical protein